MNCKNCNEKLTTEDQFCHHCGAKVIKQRITVKLLFLELSTNVFGWDTRYFITLKTMLLNPNIVLDEYLSGVRKRYVNPFAFFAIGAALSLLIFNLYAEDYIKINTDSSVSVNEFTRKIIPNYDQLPAEKKAQILKDQKESQEKGMRFFLRYFNLMAFIMLPLYTLLSFFTYRKPYNYGEHIVINAYLQGVTFLITNVFFLIAVYINPNLILAGLLSTIVFYTYAFGKLYHLSVVKSILKLLKFLVILILTSIIFAILIFALGVIVALTKKFLF